MKKVLFGLLSLTLLIGTSCKKSKDAPAFTKENVIGNYMLTKVVFSANGQEQDITSSYVDDCEKDDIVTLKIDGTYESDDAGQPCTGDYTGTWAIPAANKFDMDGEVFDVSSWDGTTMGISQAWNFGGMNGSVIIYMKKQ
ncbi:MAG TPA: hypothetical protein VD993_16370 [Chitinophagaceae bacterium]|nr:hypothetical protein [Chitinophagaceae bacterium]